MKTLYNLAPISVIIIFSFFLSSCATTAPGKLSTPSGRPETTIENANAQYVMDGVAAWLASQGKPISETGIYTISTDYSVIGFWHPSFYKTTYTIVQNGTSATLYGITYEVSPLESTLTSQEDYETMQKQLTEISAFIQTRESAQAR